SFVMADIPGLIEGAHTGKGLGIRFLRHVERTRLLVFVIDVAAGPPEEAYRILLAELEQYSAALAQKPRVVALNKIDLLPSRRVPELAFEPGVPVCALSALTGEGLREFVNLVASCLRRVMQEVPVRGGGSED
ncbi:MAG: 50S ribosome-binding GTPase, partial [candidate division KSB1 bacterium]|nr:50S ribosome-binding GTPase [candidate division KSB1 bacterium]